MQQTQWNTSQIRQCNQLLNQAMLNGEHLPVSFQHDFGHLKSSQPAAVFIPSDAAELKQIILYANQHGLPVTIRGNGMSQCGQSLPLPNGLVIGMSNFNRVDEPAQQSVWVDANASWADLLAKTMQQKLVPKVVPYNCNLSVAGVLSAGGVGAASFRYGSAVANVNELEVMTASGELQQVNETSPLMQACLGGQGRFGIITKANIALRACKSHVRTFFLLYLDKDNWLNAIEQFKGKADYMESFCSPAVQGAKLAGDRRLPFAQWFYALHVSIEFDKNPPEFAEFNTNPEPWKILYTQDETIESYMHRHDSRFAAMKMTGQWEQAHPWYECFISRRQLGDNLDEVLNSLPLYYATVVQVVPVADLKHSNFFMLPDGSDCYSLMILTPGLTEALIPGSLDAIKLLDNRFLDAGGKRYLSGYLGDKLSEEYWQRHFGSRYQQWIELKKELDPQGIFCSLLHNKKT
ncbi:FAD-binding protein [Legionella dresdenensis]|uniref:FAD-binding protein n=1 Tax=Legionella dresdenensis TaxID=450200 RepID=A0ABV8CBV9_9GAMM